jgi:hypothetical protein
MLLPSWAPPPKPHSEMTSCRQQTAISNTAAATRPTAAQHRVMGHPGQHFYDCKRPSHLLLLPENVQQWLKLHDEAVAVLVVIMASLQDEPRPKTNTTVAIWQQGHPVMHEVMIVCHAATVALQLLAMRSGQRQEGDLPPPW